MAKTEDDGGIEGRLKEKDGEMHAEQTGRR